MERKSNENYSEYEYDSSSNDHDDTMKELTLSSSSSASSIVDEFEQPASTGKRSDVHVLPTNIRLEKQRYTEYHISSFIGHINLDCCSNMLSFIV